MKHLIITLVYFAFLTSLTALFAQDTSELELSVIPDLPSRFDGCLGSYAYSMDDVDSNQIILFDGSDGIGNELSNYFIYLKVNNRRERLLLIEGVPEESDPPLGG